MGRQDSRIPGDKFKESRESASHAAESTAQLDAEDPAEPVEDAVERMSVCLGMAMVFRRVDTRTLETFHACAVARPQGLREAGGRGESDTGDVDICKERKLFIG